MTPLKRKLLHTLATASAEREVEMTFFDLFSRAPSKIPWEVSDALIELTERGFATGEDRDAQFFYTITPAGRAALIPERSVG